VDPVAHEDLRAPVVHERRNADDEGPAGVPEALVDSRIERQPLRDPVQLADSGPVERRGLKLSFDPNGHSILPYLPASYGQGLRLDMTHRPCQPGVWPQRPATRRVGVTLQQAG